MSHKLYGANHDHGNNNVLHQRPTAAATTIQYWTAVMTYSKRPYVHAKHSYYTDNN